MSLARLKETFFRLPRHIKLIGIGGLLLAVSTIMPWYADLDSYRIGDEFLGVTGPASFVGIVIFLLSGFSLWIFSYHLLERRVPRLPVREAIVHFATAVESLFLLLVVNSIYFHPKFGVNITLKESRFGMTLAVIGGLVLLIGGYFQNKEEIAENESEGKLEPLIKMEPKREMPLPAVRETTRENTQRPFSRPVNAYLRPHMPLKQAEPIEQPRRIVPQARPEARGFMFGEGEAAPGGTDATPRPEKIEKKTGDSGSYMIRTDL